MTSRLQAKIPKMFGWQLNPGYDFYLWLDGNLTMKSPDTVKFFYDQCQDADIVVFKHPRRDTIQWEYRYTYRGLTQSNYMINRYRGEWLEEQIEAIRADKDYVDDFLVNGGLFMYRNTPEVQEMFKQWWYHVTRYITQDQIAFPYVLKKSGIRVKIVDLIYNDCPWLKQQGHRAKA